MVGAQGAARGSWVRAGRVPGRWLLPEDQSRWVRLGLLVTAIVAGVLYGWRATGNLEIYYAAGVRSMSLSWHDFFFAALDPRGTVSLDKLPGAFWVQALSARLFGFSAGAIVAPQVAEGVITVLVLFRAVRRLAGPMAAGAAAAVLALSPATVALNRGNISDTLMVLLLVAAANATVSALLTGRTRHVVWAGVWVGLAFQAKMIESWLVLPALGAAYLLCGPRSIRRRAAHLAALAGVTAIVSLSWMSLLPASGRPYVDGSTDNSLFHQVFVYNGLGRLHQVSPNQLLNQAIGIHIVLSGPGSWHRFLSGEYGRDAGWLIPVAAVTLVIGLLARRRAPREDPLRAGLLLWGVWLVVFFVVLSGDSSINSYYAAALSPAVAGLIGTGIAGAAAWLSAAPSRRRSVTVAAVVAALALLTVGYTTWLLPPHGTGLPGWLLPVTIIVGVGAATAAALAIAGRRGAGVPLLGMAAALIAVLLVPAVASVSLAADRLGPFDTPFESHSVDQSTRTFLDTIQPAAALVPSLENAQYGAPDLMAAQTSALAAPFIYVSGREVLPIGGYAGDDPAPTLPQIQSMIRAGTFHLVLQTRQATDPRLIWITQHCSPVPNKDNNQFIAYFCGTVAPTSGSPKAPTHATSPPSPASTSPTTVSQAELIAAAVRVQQIVTQYPAFTLPAATLMALKADPTDPAALATARQDLGPNYVSELIALTHVPPSVLAYLEKWGPVVSHALADGPLPKP